MLAVNGSAIFTAAYVKLYANWPDYVFKKDYILPPLDNVEKFIQTYGHLPDVPSADSIQKAGLDLGGGQATLLKKIEELTLYLIDQHNSIHMYNNIILGYEEKLKLEEQRREALEERIEKLEKLIK
jgi:hypothetical protein